MTDEYLKDLIEKAAEAAALKAQVATGDKIDALRHDLTEAIGVISKDLHARISSCQSKHESRLRWRFERWLSIFAIMVAIGGTIAANWR